MPSSGTRPDPTWGNIQKVRHLVRLPDQAAIETHQPVQPQPETETRRDERFLRDVGLAELPHRLAFLLRKRARSWIAPAPMGLASTLPMTRAAMMASCR
jgi:hypothetical protein